MSLEGQDEADVLEVRLYATLRTLAGERAVKLPLEGPLTAREVIQRLVAARPALQGRVLDDQGELRPQVNVFVRGRSVRNVGGLDCTVRASDEVAIFPPVAGGAEETLELRGVPLWLLRRYLVSLGAAELTANEFVCDGWRARLEQGAKPTEGRPLLRLTPVLVTLHGEPQALAQARTAILRKARRAGG